MNLTQVLMALGQANQAVTLAAEIGGVLVPLGTFLVKEIKTLTEKGDQTIEYSLVLTTGQADIDTSRQDFTDTLSLVNAERAKANLPALVVPASTPASVPDGTGTSGV